MAATSDKVALIRGPYPYGPYEYLYVSAQRIFACVHACEGIPTEALESGVVREMVEAITEIVDHCNWQDEHHPDGRAVVHKLHYSIADNLRHILAKVRGEDGRGK